MRFRTTIAGAAGKNATGIPIPPAVLDALGGGKRPAVRLTLAGYTYRTTLGSMGGQVLASLSAEHRTAAGVAAGDEVDVDIELDAAPRAVEAPADLAAALAGDASGAGHVRRPGPQPPQGVRALDHEAKKAETAATGRVARAVEALRAGRKRY